MLFVILACTPAPEPAAAAPGPATLRGAPVAFSEWFAPDVALSAAQPGDYRTTLSYRYDGMISMERTFSQWVSAQAQLTIGADGVARGCVEGSRGSRSTESEYVSEDGENHVRTDEYDYVWGFQGRWERSGGWLLVWVSSLGRQGCDVGDDPFEHDFDGLLMCAEAALGAEREALVCHPVGSAVASPLRELTALPIGPSPGAQDGPGIDWIGVEWLVFGAGDGLEVTYRYRDGDPHPAVDLKVL